MTELVLSAITNGDRREIDWITRDMGRVFPREWEEFRDGVPAADQDGDLAAAYSRLLHDANPALRAKAAQDWCNWEEAHISLGPKPKRRLSVADPGFQLMFARLVTHYWANRCFLIEGQILRDAARLAGIPGVLIHGRFDVSGPLDTAWQLHKVWPGSSLVVLDDAGHVGNSLTKAVTDTTDRFVDLSC